jgi:hypothetical protein
MHRSSNNRLSAAATPNVVHRSVKASINGISQWISVDESLERCLLETRRHVYRLEEIAHRLSKLAFPSSHAPAIALDLLKEGNRRLMQEIEEFNSDLHVVQHLAAAHLQQVPNAPLEKQG